MEETYKKEIKEMIDLISDVNFLRYITCLLAEMIRRN